MICMYMLSKLLGRKKNSSMNEDRRYGYTNKDYVGSERRGRFEQSYKNPYKILNIHKKATHKEAKKARNSLLSKFHPDVAGHDNSLEKTKRINWAYTTLKRKFKRGTA